MGAGDTDDDLANRRAARRWRDAGEFDRGRLPAGVVDPMASVAGSCPCAGDMMPSVSSPEAPGDAVAAASATAARTRFPAAFLIPILRVRRRWELL